MNATTKFFFLLNLERSYPFPATYLSEMSARILLKVAPNGSLQCEKNWKFSIFEAIFPKQKRRSVTKKIKFFLINLVFHIFFPSRHKTSSRHLRIVLELSCLDKTFSRYLQDIFMQITCNRHFQDILILS